MFEWTKSGTLYYFILIYLCRCNVSAQQIVQKTICFLRPNRKCFGLKNMLTDYPRWSLLQRLYVGTKMILKHGFKGICLLCLLCRPDIVRFREGITYRALRMWAIPRILILLQVISAWLGPCVSQRAWKYAASAIIPLR